MIAQVTGTGPQIPLRQKTDRNLSTMRRTYQVGLSEAPEDNSEVNTGPIVAEVLDKLWYDKTNQKADFRAESTNNPKERAHQWYNNLCKSVLEVADRILPK